MPPNERPIYPDNLEPLPPPIVSESFNEMIRRENRERERRAVIRETEQRERLKIAYSKSSPQLDSVLKMTIELEAKLYNARDRIEQESNERHLESEPEGLGRREAQYLNHAKDFRRETMTAVEIINSEIPICLDNINGRRLNEILRTRHISEVVENHEQGVSEFHCNKCLLNTPAHFAYFCHGHVWCALHVPVMHVCAVCTSLKEGCKEVITYDKRKIMACTHCIKNRGTVCGNCGNSIDASYVEHGVCEQCMDNDNRQRGPTRPFAHNTKWVGKVAGDIVKSKRVFSCEIEAMTHVGNWANVLYKLVPQEVGITEDGSLRNNDNLAGFELQTPKLAGAKGEELVRHMVTATKAVEPIINSLCGMHIHLDGAGVVDSNRRKYPAELLQLWRTYIVFEDVIMSFLPFSRRRNDYCRPMSEAFKVNDLDIIDSLAEAERFWYKERTYSGIQNAKGSQYHASRYFGANFHSLLANGHFEVRFHSGTLQAKKILEWANLHALIMDACADKAMDVAFFREAQATYRLNDKTNLLFDKIGLAESSRQYFRSRQKKFGNKKNEDEEVSKMKHDMTPEPPRVSRAQRTDHLVYHTDANNITMVTRSTITPIAQSFPTTQDLDVNNNEI